MIPDRCCINPTNALLISSACAVHRSRSRASHSRLRVPTFPAQELRLGNPMAPGRECECWTGTSHQPSQGISAAPFSALSLSHHATADHGGAAVAFGPLVPGRPLLAAPGRPADPSVGGLGRSHCGRVIPPESPKGRGLHWVRIRDGPRVGSGGRRCWRLRPGCSCPLAAPGPRREEATRARMVVCACPA
jgi:hypothetical protein